VATSSAPPSQAAVAAAVDRFLASKGLRAAPQAAASAPASRPSARQAATSVVDAFLANKKSAMPAAAAAPEPPAAKPEPPPAPAPPPKPETAGFVCEDDVRRARTQGKKIFVDAKTIVTPAARDLDPDGSILVQT